MTSICGRFSRRALSVLAAPVIVAATLSLPALADPVPPLFEGKNVTYQISAGSIFRTSESLFSGIVGVAGKGSPTVQGTGTCTQVACPVTYNGKTVFARRSRLSLPGTTANAGSGTASASGDKPGAKGVIAGNLSSGQIAQTLRRGDQGKDVQRLQETLNKNGATIVVDNNYGRGTQEAVRKFQTAKGLKADGVAGAATLRSLGL